MRNDWIVLLVPLLAALAVLEAVRVVAHRKSDRKRWEVARAVVRRCARPAWLVAAAIVLEIVLPHKVDPTSRSTTTHSLTITLISGLTWLVVEVIYALTDIVLLRLNRALGTRDNRRARRARTQLLMLRRVLGFVAVIIALGTILLTFTRVRALGASMLASAGIFGAIAGVAARPSLGNLIAGLQIAFSDMVRLDDVVIVQGESGRIDDITLTYVVIRTWDERRLIVPTSYFVDNAFENWTREEARVIGTVLITLDYAVPVDDLRDEVRRILEQSALWDHRNWVVQVTDLTAQGVQVRLALSAADAGSAWDLRCEVREKLLIWLREQHPEALPRSRSESVSAPLSIPPEWAEAYAADSPNRRKDAAGEKAARSGDANRHA